MKDRITLFLLASLACYGVTFVALSQVRFEPQVQVPVQLLGYLILPNLLALITSPLVRGSKTAAAAVGRALAKYAKAVIESSVASADSMRYTAR